MPHRAGRVPPEVDSASAKYPDGYRIELIDRSGPIDVAANTLSCVDDLARAVEQYEGAEQDFLRLVKRGADREELADSAATVAEAARLWETFAYPAFFALRERAGETSRDVIQKGDRGGAGGSPCGAVV